MPPPQAWSPTESRPFPRTPIEGILEVVRVDKVLALGAWGGAGLSDHAGAPPIYTPPPSALYAAAIRSQSRPTRSTPFRPGCGWHQTSVCPSRKGVAVASASIGAGRWPAAMATASQAALPRQTATAG